MLSRQEIELMEDLNYNLVERKDINKNAQVRVYKCSSKETIISIYNRNTNSSILLYNTTFLSISKYILNIDSSKKKTIQKKKI